MKLKERLTHAWNAFTAKEQLRFDYGPSASRSNHRAVVINNVSAYVNSIFNRIAIDVSMTSFKHVKINPENEDMTDMDTGLNNCLTVEANIDQTHIQFFHDLAYSLFDEGVVAVVPVDTTVNPSISSAFDINSLRVGKIVNWFPKNVEVRLYNENTGMHQNVILEKKNVAIIENPLYSVINDNNSTLKRLMSKLNQLDDVDALAASRRLDMLIALPYQIQTDHQRALAEQRIRDIENQLTKGTNGIAYIDGTEKATQLNRPTNNQLLESIGKLTQEFYNQIGLTENVFNGTANETEMRTYYTRTIDPIVTNITSEFIRKFLTKTGRSQGQTIMAYRDMFKMVPVEILANLGDTFRRNQIATSNELRKIIGLRPSNDPLADQLSNPNIADKNQTGSGPGGKIAKKDEKLGSVVSPDNRQNDDKNLDKKGDNKS